MPSPGTNRVPTEYDLRGSAFPSVGIFSRRTSQTQKKRGYILTADQSDAGSVGIFKVLLVTRARIVGTETAIFTPSTYLSRPCVNGRVFAGHNPRDNAHRPQAKVFGGCLFSARGGSRSDPQTMSKRSGHRHRGPAGAYDLKWIGIATSKYGG
eukprot:1190108-Prorocentrum_minimum.AAC.1